MVPWKELKYTATKALHVGVTSEVSFQQGLKLNVWHMGEDIIQLSANPTSDM